VANGLGNEIIGLFAFNSHYLPLFCRMRTGWQDTNTVTLALECPTLDGVL